MELEELFVLPAYPLVVHAAVVLLPLAAVATVVCALVPRAARTHQVVSVSHCVQNENVRQGAVAR